MPEVSIEESRAARKAAREEAKAAQRVRDLEAIDALEQEHGDDSIKTLAAPRFVEGLPSLVAVRPPTASEYKRFQDQILRAKENLSERSKAVNLLAESCWAYPSKDEKDLRGRIAEAFPGILSSLGIAATKLAEMEIQEEGKG
jgi:hypothetical protein